MGDRVRSGCITSINDMLCDVIDDRSILECPFVQFHTIVFIQFFPLQISAQYLKRLKCKNEPTLAVISLQILLYFVCTTNTKQMHGFL